MIRFNYDRHHSWCLVQTWPASRPLGRPDDMVTRVRHRERRQKPKWKIDGQIGGRTGWTSHPARLPASQLTRRPESQKESESRREPERAEESQRAGESRRELATAGEPERAGESRREPERAGEPESRREPATAGENRREPERAGESRIEPESRREPERAGESQQQPERTEESRREPERASDSRRAGESRREPERAGESQRVRQADSQTGRLACSPACWLVTLCKCTTGHRLWVSLNESIVTVTLSQLTQPITDCTMYTTLPQSDVANIHHSLPSGSKLYDTSHVQRSIWRWKIVCQ